MRKGTVARWELFDAYIIGSSNISHSALTTGVEWNYRFKRSIAPDDYKIFSDTFDDMFAHRSVPATDKELTAYSLNWRKPRLVVVESPLDTPEVPEPFGVQVEALYHLSRAREEGIDKAGPLSQRIRDDYYRREA